MKKNWILIGGIAVALVAALLVVNAARTDQSEPVVQRPVATKQAPPAHSHSPNATSATNVKNIPAYLEVAPSRASLGPTLDPEKFTGLTRDAYRAVKQIPVTIAQLPCYCHCDEGFGHKSLYSCFEDDHASHCDVCVREALLALSLEKDRKLTPAQIREQIVKQYANH
jgi:hypothetical protein